MVRLKRQQLPRRLPRRNTWPGLLNSYKYVQSLTSGVDRAVRGSERVAISEYRAVGKTEEKKKSGAGAWYCVCVCLGGCGLFCLNV